MIFNFLDPSFMSGVIHGVQRFVLFIYPKSSLASVVQYFSAWLDRWDPFFLPRSIFIFNFIYRKSSLPTTFNYFSRLCSIQFCFLAGLLHTFLIYHWLSPIIFSSSVSSKMSHCISNPSSGIHQSVQFILNIRSWRSNVSSIVRLCISCFLTATVLPEK